MRLESGRFRSGEKVVVSIHGKKYSRTVREEGGKPYILIEGEKAFEDAISNNRKGSFDKNAYINEYKRTHKDLFSLSAPKGTKAIWQQYATDLGMSMNAFIIYCVEKEIHGQA